MMVTADSGISTTPSAFSKEQAIGLLTQNKEE